MRVPDYRGGGLVNLIAELEHRLSGTSASPRLSPHLRDAIPAADTYVFVLIDGLGDRLINSHPNAEKLARYQEATLDTSFSSQTSVATATMATGLPPSQHGLIAYLLRLPGSETPVNTLWWFSVDGSVPDLDLGGFLPSPNVAERLAARNIEVVVVEPEGYLGSPLDQVLYRRTRTRGVGDDESLAAAVIEEAMAPGRMIVCYLPYVDAAGHVAGTASEAYAEALNIVTGVWEEIGQGLPAHAALVGTADHGMIDIRSEDRLRLETPEGLTLYGDDRVVYVQGHSDLAGEFAAGLRAEWVPRSETHGLWGPEPFHPRLEERLPVGLIVADDGVALHYPGNELDLVGYHGGLTEAELRIPLLIWQD